MSVVDGLISGMNTTEIIRQLMSLERQPVVRLESRKSAADKAIIALQGLNTKFLAIADLAKKLSGAGGWSPLKATATPPEAVGVTVADGTAPTSLTFKIKSLAAAHQVYSTGSYASESTQVATAGREITIGYTADDGTAATLALTDHDGTLAGIAGAINDNPDSPINARVVKTSDAGDYRLELTAKTTGASSFFTVTGIRQPPTAEMTFAAATEAADAEILFGSSGSPLTIRSKTNTMVDVAPGVTLTLRKADINTTVVVDVARDSATITADVEKLVAAANDLLKEAKALVSYDAAGKKSGLLQGNTTVRDLQRAVLEAVSSAVGGVSAATAGLQLTRDGALKFDKAKFESAYAADPAAVTALFSGPAGMEGIAQRLAAVSESATKSTTGLLTQAIASRRAEIKRIDTSIAMWDVRLMRRESALRRQFAALETALGAAQQQGNWLAGQIASLPKISSD